MKYCGSCCVINKQGYRVENKASCKGLRDAMMQQLAASVGDDVLKMQNTSVLVLGDLILDT